MYKNPNIITWGREAAEKKEHIPAAIPSYQ